MTDLRIAAQRALEQLKINRTNFRKGPSKSICKMLAGGNDEAIADLEAALAEPTGKDSLQVEPTVAENATTQQQIEQTPPSEYRRGYWDGFNIGKREGRIEAEDELAKQAEPVTIERLRDALVASRIIWPAAVEDPEGYDDGVTLHRIEALHRRLT